MLRALLRGFRQRSPRRSQRRRIGIGDRLRVQWRVHVAGIDGEETDAVGFASSAQMAVRWRSAFAGAIGAPTRIGVDARVAGDVDDKRPASVAGGGGKRAEQGFGQPERPQQVDRERLLQVLAIGVGKRRERRRAEARCVVDEDVKAVKIAGDLQRDRVNVVLAPDVTDDSRMRRSHPRSVRPPGRCGRRRRHEHPSRQAAVRVPIRGPMSRP